jgi:hypothetical protein
MTPPATLHRVRRPRRGRSHRMLRAALPLVSGVLLLGCSQAVTDTLDLSGTWAVTAERVGPATGFGTTGTMMVVFSAAAGGDTEFRGIDEASGMTVCRSYATALVDETVLIFGAIGDDFESGTAGRAYLVESIGGGAIQLVGEVETLTLTRVIDPPVAACGAAIVVAAHEVMVPRPSWTGFAGFESILYFNTGDGNPIVGYSTVTNDVVSERSYTPFIGQTNRVLLASEGHDVFFGHCACGRSSDFSRFDLDTNTTLATRSTITDLGAQTILRYGYVDGDQVVLGGRRDADSAGSSLNKLLVLDGTTLDLVSTRTVLDGVSLTGVTRFGGDLLAATQDWEIVVVREDGRAAATHVVPALAGLTPRGIATAGGALYLLATDWTDAERVWVLHVELP